MPTRKVTVVSPGELVFITQTILGSDAADITITGLPTTGYRDLVVVFKTRSTRATADDTYFRVGSGSIDTGSHYSDYAVYGPSAGSINTDSTRGYLAVQPGADRNAGVFCQGEITLYDYASSAWKMMIGRALYYERAVQGYATWTVNIAWNQTTAIDQVRMMPNFGPNLKAGSFLTVYGRK